MIINILVNLGVTLLGFVGKLFNLAFMPNEIFDNIVATTNLLFSNFGMINIICHLSYAKIIMSLAVSLVAFRITLNMVRYIFAHKV